ncbi:unnamed protein product [Linum trigynum]|uniref:Uncharacterized protein n=1 Tax=Linum trigynum TaxID=586398 RepID=A0AAV2ESR6_9ROSI
MLPAATASDSRTPFVASGGGLHHHIARPRSGGLSALGRGLALRQVISSSAVKCSLSSTPPSAAGIKMLGRPCTASTFPHPRHSSSRRTADVAVRSAGVDPVAVADALPAGISLPFDLPHDSQWQLWLLGAVASFAIPLATGKLGPLGKLFDKFDAAVDTAQGVAEMVDQMAEKVEEVADDIGNSLPAGALKEALEYVENLADQTEKAAEYAGDLLDKVEEVGDKVEAFAESAIAKKPSSSSSTIVVVSQEVKAEI